jgi:hypothetical protein
MVGLRCSAAPISGRRGSDRPTNSSPRNSHSLPTCRVSRSRLEFTLQRGSESFLRPVRDELVATGWQVWGIFVGDEVTRLISNSGFGFSVRASSRCLLQFPVSARRVRLRRKFHHFSSGNRRATSSALARLLKALMRKQPSPSNQNSCHVFPANACSRSSNVGCE